MFQKTFFDDIYRRKIICGKNADKKMSVLKRLMTLSACGTSGQSAKLGGIRGGGISLPALERNATYLIHRAKILNLCSDPDLRAYLEYYSRHDTNILTDITTGKIETKFIRAVLNEALDEICNKEECYE